MKIALIAFGDFDLNRARVMFSQGGIPLSAAQILSPDDDIGFKRGYETFRDTADALVISDGAEFDLKETVAEFSGYTLIENENARKTLEERGVKWFSGALMPEEATLIPNEHGDYQGFALDERDFTLITLPAAADGFFPSFEKYAGPYLAAKLGVQKSAIFKCFGDADEIRAALKELKENLDFDFSLSNDNGDITVSVFFSETDDGEVRARSREIAFAIKDSYYADGNVSLAETLFTLLKLGGKKISVAESFTGGEIARAIISNAGASACFYEGIVAYSEDSKAKRLGVPQDDLQEYGAVSAKVAYRMAAGLFSSGKPDVVLATTGLAGPDGDGTDKPVGLCFVAAGTKEGIHVYKFVFSGGRREITQKGVNAALFTAIKILKNV